MAITKLMHINPGRKGTAVHLKNSLQYILNPEKTEDRYLVGGNAGSDPEEVLKVMLETKKEWGKEDRRQGYHFVLSFSPGEVTREQAFLILQEFCEEYLGEEYDHVFAIHTDQTHLHGHLIFNSVSRTTGYKYRYEKGDWEKSIQPVTDRICKKHGISPLEFDPEKKKGRSYAEHLAEKTGRPTWTKIIKADIDFAVARSSSWEGFLEEMRQLGYQVKEGKHVTFLPPGAKKGRRDSSLGEGYRKEEIRERILQPEKEKKRTKILSPELERAYENGLKRYRGVALSRYQICRIRVFYQAGHYLEGKNPYAVGSREIRAQAIRIQKLYEECMYLLDHGIRSPEGLRNRKQELEQKEGELKKKWKRNPGPENGEKELLKGLRKERRMVERMLVEEETGMVMEKGTEKGPEVWR